MNEIEKHISQLRELAVKFRTNDDLNGVLALKDVLNTITSNPAVLINSNTNAIANILKSIYECQSKEDCLGIADYLEYDLIRAIDHPLQQTHE